MRYFFNITIMSLTLIAGDIFMNKNLTEFEKYILFEKGTEKSFSGEYNEHDEKGVYRCKNCNEPLFKSDAKFHSGTGWPSFDDAIEGKVKEVADADGMRVEIVCANCGAHLGHVFKGEGFTDKNTRHCVNSISLEFDSNETDNKK